VSEIECDNKKEMERRLETLRMWKRKCGSSATHRMLVEAFLKCQRVDLAETVFNHLEQRSTNVSKSRIGYPLPQNYKHTALIILHAFIQSVRSKAQDQMFGAVNQGDVGKVAQLLGDGLDADMQQTDVRIIIAVCPFCGKGGLCTIK